MIRISLKIVLIIVTLTILLFNILYGNLKEGMKVNIIFLLYLLYLIIS